MIWVYIFMVLVMTLANLDKWDLLDIFASFLIALAWPIILPATIIRGLIR